ncbi:MAG TPA: glycosyl hydrolase [Longimicrobiaceae bacterium]|nr:glycosyl hydrolase [Longimicrobiaceae bacterium]
MLIHFRARLPFAMLAAVLSLAACQDSPTGVKPTQGTTKTKPAPTPSPTPAPTAQPFYAGAYLGDAATKPDSIAKAIGAFATLTGKQPALVKSFQTIDCDFTATGWCGRMVRNVVGTGSTPYLAMDVRWAGAPAGGVLDAIAAGQADAVLIRAAQGIAAVGRPVLIEPAWEMNGNWDYAWQGTLNGGDATAPARYAAAWRHIVDVFRANGAGNVRWVFNPNVGNPLTHTASGASHWNWYANYYPGDAYVDYVGAHGFNGPSVWGGSWQDFGTMTDGTSADRMLSDLAARYTKPIIIGEFATQEGTAGQKAQWITDAYARMRANPRIAGCIWFNAAKEADWRVQSSPTALAAYQAAVTASGVQTAFAAPAPAGNLLASR